MTQALENLIISIKNKQEVNDFLTNLFTKCEIDTLKKRWRILELLKSGTVQRDIAKELNVSLCKVTRGAKILKNESSIVNKFLKKEIK